MDQILPTAGDPRLWERYVASAQDYVALAEARPGPSPAGRLLVAEGRRAMQVLDVLAPDLRIVNLETSITRHATLPGCIRYSTAFAGWKSSLLLLR